MICRDVINESLTVIKMRIMKRKVLKVSDRIFKENIWTVNEL